MRAPDVATKGQAGGALLAAWQELDALEQRAQAKARGFERAVQEAHDAYMLWLDIFLAISPAWTPSGVELHGQVDADGFHRPVYDGTPEEKEAALEQADKAGKLCSSRLTLASGDASRAWAEYYATVDCKWAIKNLAMRRGVKGAFHWH